MGSAGHAIEGDHTIQKGTRYNVDYVKSKVRTWHFQCWRHRIGRVMYADHADISRFMDNTFRWRYRCIKPL